MKQKKVWEAASAVSSVLKTPKGCFPLDVFQTMLLARLTPWDMKLWPDYFTGHVILSAVISALLITYIVITYVVILDILYIHYYHII